MGVVRGWLEEERVKGTEEVGYLEENNDLGEMKWESAGQ